MALKKTIRLVMKVTCCFILSGEMRAQLPISAAPVYAHYHTTNSGLPTDLIYRLHSDDNGYLWLATDQGLLRYNGRSFTQVNTGMPEDFVSSFVTSNKQLWLFAYSGHTAGIDLNTQKVINTDSIYGLQRLPSAGSIFLLGSQQDKQTVSIYKQGKWVVNLGLNSGKSYVENKTSEEKTQQLLRQYRFTPDQQQQLMSELNTIFRRNCFGLSVNDSFVTIGNRIFHAVPGKEAKYYFNGTDYGITTYIMGFARRNEDLYLGGLHDIGLCRIKGYFSRPRDRQEVEHLLPGEAVTSLAQDYLGNIWVSTHGNGLFLFPYAENNTLYYNKNSGLYGNKVSSINHFSNGITTLGYDDAVLDFYIAGNIKPKRYILPVKNDIRDVRYVEKMASCWLAFTPNETFHAKNQNNVLPDVFHRVVIEGAGIDPGYKNGRQYNDIFHYVSGNGMVFIDTTGRLRRRNMSGKVLPKQLCVLPLFDSVFYIGTVRGCYLNNNALPYLQNVQVNAVDTVAGQLLWATNTGVFALPLQDANNRFQLRKITSGACTSLKHDAFFTYLRNGDEIIMVQSNTLKPIAKFSCRDYIIPFRLNRFYIHDDYIVLTGNRGIFYLPRQHFLPSVMRKPKMHVLCSLNGRAPSDSTYTCRYSDDLSVLFEFDILDYTNKQHEIDCRIFRNGKEQYRQAGLDQRGAVSLHPDAPGSYCVEYHVRSNEYGMEQIMAYTLVVLPLWYQQWWCLPVLILLAGAVIIYALYRLHVHKLEVDRRKLKQKLYLHELESQSLLGQLKPHFIFNILTPLQGFFMSGEKIKGLNYLDSFSRLMRGMLNSIRGRYTLLSTELELIQYYLNIQQERFDHCFSYKIIVDPLLDTSKCIIPTLMLQPLVENAVQHGINKANKNNVIAIIVENDGKAVSIRIKDNGKGLPADFSMKDNHALTIITERVQLLKKINGIGHFGIYNNGKGVHGATSLLILSKDNQL